ncbi:MAG TPA: 4-(cytidine 5'-diphospho)-2-C-methyl-D-erythritol kinase [Desulfobacteraceae bacterium]|nr:4-(cytidine 5'-diphospho)-2-C-methyl-D-erythritol kinase [Desulfobacteraceae bacterium]
MMSNPINCRVQAPAKINFLLKVVGKRPDGYHNLVSVMVPVDLCDSIHLHSTQEAGISLTCKGLSLPSGEDNLVFRAAEAFYREAGILPRVHMTLDKVIPVAAGLGGGSSDAAVTLLALNDHYQKPLPRQRLGAIAAKLGADVPFFLYRRPCIATGIGDVLEPLELWPSLWYLIIKPPFSVSTGWVYRNLKLELTSTSTEDILKHLKKQPFEISRLLENDLERVTASKFPVILTIKKALLEAGAAGVGMSGSGPSVFGVFTDRGRLNDAARVMFSLDFGQVFAVRGL